MKTKSQRLSELACWPLYVIACILVVLPIFALALATTTPAKATDFSGPNRVPAPNYKQPRTDYNALVFESSVGVGEPWLTLSGNPDAKTMSEQWAPEALTIRSRREPVVERALDGVYVIRFR